VVVNTGFGGGDSATGPDDELDVKLPPPLLPPSSSFPQSSSSSSSSPPICLRIPFRRSPIMSAKLGLRKSGADCARLTEASFNFTPCLIWSKTLEESVGGVGDFVNLAR